MAAFVYMLECADSSFYVGSTRTDLETRLAQHQSGFFGGYTSARLPVRLIWSEAFPRIEDAIEAERRLKGWSRAKKLALCNGDWPEVQRLARRKPSTVGDKF